MGVSHVDALYVLYGHVLFSEGKWFPLIHLVHLHYFSLPFVGHVFAATW
jgi:hypothetical protein